MATAERALEVCRSLLGTGEQPPGSNCNFLTAWAGIGCVAWCDITCSFVLCHTFGDGNHTFGVPGVGHDYPWGDAYVPSTKDHYTAAGYWITDRSQGRPGDLVVFDWGSGPAHIGMVEQALADGTYITLEGNTSDQCRRLRRSQAVIAGFCRPPYDTAAPQAAPPKGALVYPQPIPVGSHVTVASLDCPTGGAWELTAEGNINNWGTAPHHGAPNGQAYWAGRKAAELAPLGNGYTVIDTAGERYDFPA